MSEETKRVCEAYRAMWRAATNRDTQTLATLLDDSFVLRHMTGREQSKDEFLASIADGSLRYFSETEQSCTARVDRDRATLMGRSVVDASPFGFGRSTWRLQQEMELVRRRGHWHIIRSVASMF